MRFSRIFAYCIKPEIGRIHPGDGNVQKFAPLFRRPLDNLQVLGIKQHGAEHAQHFSETHRRPVLLPATTPPLKRVGQRLFPSFIAEGDTERKTVGAELGEFSLRPAAETLPAGKEVDAFEDIGFPLCVFSDQQIDARRKEKFTVSDVAKLMSPK